MSNNPLEMTRFTGAEPSRELIEEVRVDAEKINYSRRRINASLMGKMAVVAAIVLMVAVGFNIFNFNKQDESYSYYTVDINPSVLLKVNDKKEVVETIYLNTDAKTLLEKINLKGKDYKIAIKEVIAKADEGGYFTGEEDYVLVGRFADDTKEEVVNLQSELENEFSELINLVFIEGTTADKNEALEKDVSPGLLKLSKLANEVTVDKNAKIEDVINEVNLKNEANFLAPILSAKSENGKINFSSSKLNFLEFGYTGEVKYKLMYAESEDSFAKNEATLLKEVKFNTTSSYILNHSLTSEVIEPGSEYYYGIIAEYSNGKKIVSNLIKVKMIEEETNNTEPKTLSGVAKDSNLYITWSKINTEVIGYKVVSSSTNENPTTSDTIVKYIQDPSINALSIYPSSTLVNGKAYFIKVGYIYKDGKIDYSNSVKLTMPAKKVEEAPKVYKTSTIQGTIDGSSVKLTWSRIDDSEFYGHKIMYSFEYSEPIYGVRGNYAAFVSDQNTLSKTFDLKNLTGYAPGKKVYFAVSTLYKQGEIVKTSNTINFTASIETVSYPLVTLSGGVDNDTIYLNWDKIETNASYQLLYAYSSGGEYTPYETTSSNYMYIKTNEGSLNFQGKTVYFKLKITYPDNTIKYSNIKAFEIPNVSPTINYITPTLQGTYYNYSASLSWNRIIDDNLSNYKIIMSPVGAETAYSSNVYQVLSADLSEYNVSLTQFVGATSVKISLMAIYKDGVTKTSNEIIIPIPVSGN